MEETALKQAVETLLFITDHPLPVSRLAQVLEGDEERISAAIQELKDEYAAKGGIQVLEIAGGFQMSTPPAHAAFIRKLYADKMTMRLSAAALETLSIIAYKQPITRAEVEEIRGVDVIAALETLLDKRLIKVVDRRESVGRPLLYGTTPEFMRHFGLKSLEDLPPIESFQVEPPAVPETAKIPEAVAVADGAALAPKTTIGTAVLDDLSEGETVPAPEITPEP